ncbi:MAG: nucleoside-diphosphate kinase [Holosporales bacterium]|nr:nucleoside-diphosphate kinase [Holosporales bacterium]
MERTLAIIKPDAADKADEINKMIEAAGLKVIAKKTTRLSLEKAKEFYEIHKDRPFYDSLCEFMSSGDVVIEVLEGPEAVSRYRTLMGATDARKAEEGTIRKAFGTDNQKNAVHGSDSLENAAKEISSFFSDEEIGG